jgi:hypothetical protein
MTLPLAEFFETRGFVVECYGPGVSGWRKLTAESSSEIIVTGVGGQSGGVPGERGPFAIELYTEDSNGPAIYMELSAETNSGKQASSKTLLEVLSDILATLEKHL